VVVAVVVVVVVMVLVVVEVVVVDVVVVEVVVVEVVVEETEVVRVVVVVVVAVVVVDNIVLLFVVLLFRPVRIWFVVVAGVVKDGLNVVDSSNSFLNPFSIKFVFSTKFPKWSMENVWNGMGVLVYNLCFLAPTIADFVGNGLNLASGLSRTLIVLLFNFVPFNAFKFMNGEGDVLSKNTL